MAGAPTIPSGNGAEPLSSAAPRAIGRHAFESEDALARAVADCVGGAIRAALEARGAASLVVTGGSTPRAYYPLLAALELRWDRVQLVLSDERWVDVADAESNQRLVHECLLQGPAARARLIGLKTAAASAQLGCAEAAARVAAVPHPYDLVLLGVGADTHVASLFPAAAGIERALDPHNLDRCVAMNPPPGIAPDLPRISLTLAELLDTRRVVLAVRGADKLRHIDQALAGHWPQPTALLQLARLAPALDLYWSP